MKRYQHIVKKHKPRGYRLLMRKLNATYGLAQFVRQITIDRELPEREALFYFLHECGHVNLRHLKVEQQFQPTWLMEYEADQYAIKAMKADGIPIPRRCISENKEVMRDYIKKAHDIGQMVDDAVLKYAYGRDWRKHRLVGERS
jgi:hypothetical protein